MPINTTRSWARVIEAYEDIPQFYREHFAAFSLGCADPPYTVFAPPDRSFGRKQNSRIICATGEEIRIYEKYRKQLSCTVFPIRDIQYIETGCILLYSWIKLSGMTGSGLCTVSWTYNTSTEPIFRPVIEKARGLKTTTGTDTDAFDPLLSLSYKYLNMAKSAVSPAQEIRKLIPQPEIKEPRFTLFGKTFYRTLVPSGAIILTAGEMILLSVNADRGLKSGGTKRFIPLTKIRDVSITPCGDRYARCTLRLPGDEKVQISLEQSNLAELMMERYQPV